MNVDANDPGLKVSLQIPEEEEKMFSSKYSILCLSAQKYLQLLKLGFVGETLEYLSSIKTGLSLSQQSTYTQMLHAAIWCCIVSSDLCVG